MAIKNPQGNFNFRLQLAGVDNARIQMLTPPTVEYAEHKQGTQGISPDQKTPGKKLVGDMTVEILVPDTGDGDIWAKLKECETMSRPVYAGDAFLYELDANGSPVSTFKAVNSWIKKVETANHETTQDNSGDLKRTVTISVEDYLHVA